MTYTYWIDKQGGSHYHKEDCPMIKDPKYHYKPITRTKPRRPDKHGWGLTRIKEGGQYYMMCPACFGRRRSRISL